MPYPMDDILETRHTWWGEAGWLGLAARLTDPAGFVRGCSTTSLLPREAGGGQVRPTTTFILWT